MMNMNIKRKTFFLNNVFARFERHAVYSNQFFLAFLMNE